MPTLTEAFVRRARPRARKYEVCCAPVGGFVLRVLPSGAKIYYTRRNVNGKDVRRRLGPASELSFAEARRQALAQLAHAPAAASPGASGAAPRLRDVIPRFLAEHVDIYLKPTTRRRYRSAIARHITPRLGAMRLDAIASRDVARVHRELRATPCQANNVVRILSSIFSFARRVGALPSGHISPTRGLRAFREPRRERFLSAEERARLERVLCAGEAKRPGVEGALRWSTVAAIRLLALTGMRRGEVLQLTWSMVDAPRRCLRLPDSKTGQRVIPVNSQALALLRSLERRRVPGCEHVLYSRTLRPLDGGGLEVSWGRIRRRARLHDVRLHDLRHSAASDAINAGVPLEVIQRILGHADIRTTQRYAHLERGVVAAAVERMGAAIERSAARGRLDAESAEPG